MLLKDVTVLVHCYEETEVVQNPLRFFFPFNRIAKLTHPKDVTPRFV